LWIIVVFILRFILVMSDIYNDGTYLNKAPTWHAENSKWKASKIIKILQKNSITPYSVAEIGCGSGQILVELKKLDKTNIFYTGYEISKDAFKICSVEATEKLSFIFGDGSDKSNKKHDVCLIADVFEHVDNYPLFLKDIKSSNLYKKYIFHIPLDISVLSVLRVYSILRSRRRFGHIHQFTKEIALEILSECGYEVIDMEFTFSATEINYTWKSKLLKYPRLLLYKLNADLAVRLVGGASLLVLAK
jgi:SAM-dependent methyltransferase